MPPAGAARAPPSPAPNQAPGSARGVEGALAVAGAAEAGVAPPAGGTPKGADGACGTGCAGIDAAPAAFAPAATPRPKSAPNAVDIARAGFCCTAAEFAALAADAPLAGLTLPINPDSGPIPELAAPLNGEPPLGADGTCGNDGTCGICGFGLTGPSVAGSAVRPVTAAVWSRWLLRRPVCRSSSRVRRRRGQIQG